MTGRRALVVHTRMPAFDRDSGSQDIDNSVAFLLDAGWSVTYLAREEEGVAEERHAQRLRRMGVATYAGFGWAERVLRSNSFDLVLVAFWELAAQLLPVIREVSPSSRVVVNSMDVHFLRHARRSFGLDEDLVGSYGADTARELNTYNGADAIITVSEKERALLGDFLGDDRVFTVPLAENVEWSSVPLAERRGMFFVANFRHLPNREAAEYLCGDVLPMIDRALLEQHPLTVVGNWLNEAKLDIDPDLPGVNLVGWVPSVAPYLERARVSVVPLLHGAGVKRKVLQSMMSYTPVVTTPIGAEGLDVVSGEHALVAVDATDLAAGVTRLLTDDALWLHLAKSGAEHAGARHGKEVVRRTFDDVIDRVMSRPQRVRVRSNGNGSAAADHADDLVAAVRSRVRMLAEPGAIVLVASGGNPALVELGSQPCWHFPHGTETEPPGAEPVDGNSAVNHLEAQRTRGARYLVLPKPSFVWRYRYPELHEHLERRCHRIHRDEHLIVYDLAAREETVLAATPSARVQVIGTYSARRSGPPPDLVAELGNTDSLEVEQCWHSDADDRHLALPAGTPADYVVFVRDDAILPSRFLDDLIATQASLAVDRLQPSHMSGAQGGPPVTERCRGTVAREVDEPTPLPVLSVRTGATLDGPVVLADNVTVGLREPLTDSEGVDRYSSVRRVWVVDAERHLVEYQRPEPAETPRISVLIATYNRSALLRACLQAFAEQTLEPAEYEVVVVDDGSDSSVIDSMLEEFAGNLQIVGLRIEHGGRSAAKNLAVLLARSPIVLFFDDDDRPAPDYLERHVKAHATKPDEAVAILGHTDWAPELRRTPLMHFITDVDRLMFAYDRLGDGQTLDWRGFWEGRISCKRALLTRYGLHDQRLNYSIDVEMGWRLQSRGLRVIYDASARSVMARPLDFDGFCERTEAKGKALAVIAALHPGTKVADGLEISDAVEFWEKKRSSEPELRRRVAMLETAAEADDSVLSDLYGAYRDALRLVRAKGIAEAVGGAAAAKSGQATPRVSIANGGIVTGLPTTVQPFENTDPDLVYDGSPDSAPEEPHLSISIPVWSRTPQLAEMARETIERIWDVARVPTEVVVVDNGSPFEVPLAAKVYRYPENKGVATGWNTGVRLSTAPVVCVLNSDCRVEPGWDEALYEAATDGRRVAFPYTDHCDGLGFVSPDQGGTAGWCFMMSKAVYEEVGVFDEWFNPAFCEDTDYWHRAWLLGIELNPVPAARVVHARRTTASTDSHVDWLLLGHRYKYGWKHGVDPLRAPPYYNRDVVEYRGRSGR